MNNRIIYAIVNLVKSSIKIEERKNNKLQKALHELIIEIEDKDNEKYNNRTLKRFSVYDNPNLREKKIILLNKNLLQGFRGGIIILELGNKEFLKKTISEVYQKNNIKISKNELRQIKYLYIDRRKMNSVDLQIIKTVQKEGAENGLKMIKLVPKEGMIIIYGHFRWRDI